MYGANCCELLTSLAKISLFNPKIDCDDSRQAEECGVNRSLEHILEISCVDLFQIESEMQSSLQLPDIQLT